MPVSARALFLEVPIASRPVRLFVYVVRHDAGFAPNPFFGYCTLATCKPRIRGTAEVGDWVAGVGSVQCGREGKLVYAMRVAETMDFDDYWADPRFALKRPSRDGDARRRCGDNIYHRDPGTGDWIQEPGGHSCDDGTPDRRHVRRDTGANRVLIGEEFAYFGAGAVDIPSQFRPWRGVDYFSRTRGHRCRLPEDLRDTFVAWLEELSLEAGGLAGTPLAWSDRSPGSACT